MEVKAFFEEQHTFLIGFLVTALAAGLLQLFGAIWTYAWILMVAAGFLGGFLVKKAGKGFLAGFLGVLVAWLVYFLIFSFIGPIWEFANVLAGLFGLTGMGFVVIILSLVLIGGLIGGLGALNGHFVASILFEKE
ncbi:MAG: hypothetical protein HWN66_09065 [Candidatus Helarchaeota archaeon]|nr:hypothetical protein [Candidatus Helarchaeota archaeon]